MKAQASRVIIRPTNSGATLKGRRGLGRLTGGAAPRNCPGFSWGFTINQQDITFARPAALGPEAWDSHLDLLTTDYPTGSLTADISPPNSLCLIAARRVGPAQHECHSLTRGFYPY
jgi:hypothetical protein